MMKENTLPEGWEMKTIWEIGKPSMCKRILKEQTCETWDIPFYKIGTFGKTPNAFISNEIYTEYKNKYSFPKQGDILLSASGTIGKRVIYNGEPAFFQDSNIVWIDNDEKMILNSYLYHFYSICDWQPSKGATISRLYNANLKRIKISFPVCLDEQRKIVKLITNVFENIEEAKKIAEENLKNAKDLFESYLERVFHEKGEDWEQKTLEEVCEKMFAGWDVPKNNFTKHISEKYKIPIYANWIKNNWLYWYTDISKVIDPSLTISARGTIWYIVERNEPFFPIVRLIVLIPKINEINLSFLKYLLKTIDILQSWASIPQLTIPMIKKYKLNFPKDIKKQIEIVWILDNLSTHINELEELYKNKSEKLEELKKSILERSFVGEL